MKRIVAIADLHCGSKAGLTPPSWHYGVPEDAHWPVRKAADFRARQWEFYAATIAALQPIDRLLVLGDAIDGKQVKDEGIDLIVNDRQEQVRMAVDCIELCRAVKVAFVYGSGYHTGNREDWENDVAEKFGGDIGAEQDIKIQPSGIVFNCKHFIGNTNSPASRFTALSGEQIRQLLWAETGQQPKADVILRAHIHRYAHAEEDGWSAWVCPPLQGLGGRIARKRSGLPLSYGLLHFDVEDNGDYTWHKHLQPLALQAGRILEW